MKLRSKLSFFVSLATILILLGSLFYFGHTVYLYKGIETFYRIMLIVVCAYISLCLIFALHYDNQCKRKKKYYFTLISMIIFIAIFLMGSIFMKRIYNSIGSMNKTTITYSTKLISFKKYDDINKLKDVSIGILNQKDDIENNTLPNEVIEKFSLDQKCKITKYETALEMMNDLYGKNIDLIFVNGSFVDIYSTFEEYSDIEKKANVVYSYEKEMEKTKVEKDTTSKVSSLTEPFTILLLGIDSTAETLEKNASFNGDTMILITFNPKTMRATMLSLPRDTFVPVSCNGGRLQRINTSAWCGTNGAVKTIEKLTGIDIDYYVKINFKGVVNIVDALGGIDVDVPYAFCEQDSSRRWDQYTQYVESGMQHLNGEQALALARNRKTSSYCESKWNKGTRNDFVRGQNQQIVLKGLINSAKDLSTITEATNILNSVSKSIDTNLKTEQILSLYDLVKAVTFNKDANVLNIQKMKLKVYTMGKSGHMIYEPSTKSYASVAFYYKGSLKDITNAMKVNLGQSEEELVKEFKFSINDQYKETIIGDGSYSESKYTMVPNLSGYSVDKIKSYASSNGLSLKFLDKDTNSSVSISSFDTYKFYSQNEKEFTPLFRINSLTIYVSKNSVAPKEEDTTKKTTEEDTTKKTEEDTTKKTEEDTTKKTTEEDTTKKTTEEDTTKKTTEEDTTKKTEDTTGTEE